MLAFYVAILDTEEQKDKFTEIYTTYYGMMYQVARAITHDDKLAEDALHETCLELIEKIDSIRTDNAKQLAYYLRMVTRNRTIDFMRKWDRRVRYLMTRWMWNQHPYMKMLRMSY